MSSNAISISSLEFSWGGNQPLLLDLPEFKVQSGEKVFLCGPSGSGKSTLLNLIGGVLVPSKGRLSILESELTALKPNQRDRVRGNHLGFIFQMFNLIPYLSVVENVVLPCQFSGHKKKKVLDTGLTLEEEAERLLLELKIDFKSLSRRPVVELSVGQQQRVATARALMGKPDIIVADEPTSALDADTRDAFVQLLFNECERSHSTVLFVSHDSSLGNKFDRTVYLQEINRSHQKSETL